MQKNRNEKATKDAREIFDAARDAAKARGDVDAASRAELLREFFTNPEFRKALSEMSYVETSHAGGRVP